MPLPLDYVSPPKPPTYSYPRSLLMLPSLPMFLVGASVFRAGEYRGGDHRRGRKSC
jgi:hypothetical protein